MTEKRVELRPGIALILSGLLRPRLMKGKKSHEIQGDPV